MHHHPSTPLHALIHTLATPPTTHSFSQDNHDSPSSSDDSDKDDT